MDTAVAELILHRLTPLAMEVALTVTDEITAQAEHADRIRATHVQRAQHTADLARRRYLAVDPANRLVADHLEADYNTALHELACAKDEYDTAKTRAERPLDDAHRNRIRALAADFPALWNDPATPMRERKRLPAAGHRRRPHQERPAHHRLGPPLRRAAPHHDAAPSVVR